MRAVDNVSTGFALHGFRVCSRRSLQHATLLYRATGEDDEVTTPAARLFRCHELSSEARQHARIAEIIGDDRDAKRWREIASAWSERRHRLEREMESEATSAALIP